MGLKQLAQNKNLNTNTYWCLPGFTRDACVANKNKPETRLNKRKDLIQQDTVKDFIPKVLKQDNNVFTIEIKPQDKKKLDKENLVAI